MLRTSSPLIGTLGVTQDPPMNSLEDPNAEDPGLDDEEREIVAALSEADIHDIDEAILDSCPPTWTKVALVVGIAMEHYPDRFLEVPDIYYSERIKNLVAAGRLLSQGNLRTMRSSEIRTP